MSRQSLLHWPKHSFLGILITLVGLLIITPIIRDQLLITLTLQIFFPLFIIATIYSLSSHKKALIVGILLALPALLLDWSNLYYKNIWILIGGHLFSLFFLVFAALILSKRIFNSIYSGKSHIYGAISVYLLSGIIFALLYSIIDISKPGSFFGSHPFDFSTMEGASSHLQQFIYFSFVTLTTLGYGDITPATEVTQSFSISEAFYGQLFIATVIARLVSLRRK